MTWTNSENSPKTCLIVRFGSESQDTFQAFCCLALASGAGGSGSGLTKEMIPPWSSKSYRPSPFHSLLQQPSNSVVGIGLLSVLNKK